MRTQIILIYSFQSFRDGHFDFSFHADCLVAGGSFGRRNPRHESFGVEESSLEGSGTKSAKLNGLLPFFEMYWSLAFPFVFRAFGCGSIFMAFEFSLVTSCFWSWIAWPGDTSFVILSFRIRRCLSSIAWSCPPCLLARASKMHFRRALRASPIVVI